MPFLKRLFDELGSAAILCLSEPSTVKGYVSLPYCFARSLDYSVAGLRLKRESSFSHDLYTLSIMMAAGSYRQRRVALPIPMYQLGTLASCRWCGTQERVQDLRYLRP
jgi:hypothetical protein